MPRKERSLILLNPKKEKKKEKKERKKEVEQNKCQKKRKEYVHFRKKSKFYLSN